MHDMHDSKEKDFKRPRCRTCNIILSDPKSIEKGLCNEHRTHTIWEKLGL